MAREMKDSGVEWIGQIPKSWEVVKVKNIFKNTKKIVGDREKEFERLALTLKGVLKRDKNDNKGLQSEKFSTYQILEKDELVFKMIDLENKNTSRVGFSKYIGIVSPVYIILNNDKYTRYGYYFFYDMWQRYIFNTLGNNGVRSALNAKDMLNLPFLKLDLREQEKIANYLDKKVMDIDLIIEKTKITIENYKKYKQSIITEAVTKGLNPNVEMKDSGIEWIGQIPKHWKKINPKALFYQRKDRAKKDDRQLTASQKYGIMYQDEFMEKEGVRVTVVQKDFDILKHVEPNDFVISMRSFQGGLEYSELSGCISSAYVMLIPNLGKVYPKFFKFFFKSFKYINALQSTSNLVRDGQAMRYSNFSQLYLVEIPLEEQKEIAEYLDKKIAEIDNLIAKKESLISEMEEYKKSLIYECVTGKKEII